MFSYISYCLNGKAEKKFGLTEEYGDYKVVLKIYYGNVCARNPEKYWIGQTQEMDITRKRHSPLWKDIGRQISSQPSREGEGDAQPSREGEGDWFSSPSTYNCFETAGMKYKNTKSDIALSFCIRFFRGL
ncbi:hypothetical protein AVEN_58017-1 [Araneus ventricosus]|uniref:Uncharacterized protein n=1 Tax=Araneus ventricosus TaxID=182803 RepID=A0A4Y2CCY1_ARAVE|nr:hypothetical protein AVEN_6337-1 [Araneus ventricosus]GBM02335.1 hypothetical protein AVEN_58017-1 [Araneus ventricosus]